MREAGVERPAEAATGFAPGAGPQGMLMREGAVDAFLLFRQNDLRFLWHF
jgi:hypothetical protein